MAFKFVLLSLQLEVVLSVANSDICRSGVVVVVAIVVVAAAAVVDVVAVAVVVAVVAVVVVTERNPLF